SRLSRSHSTQLRLRQRPPVDHGRATDIALVLRKAVDVLDPASQTLLNRGRDYRDANPDALIASSIALAAGRARKADGGFIVNGRWPFSSAVDNSDWNMLAVTVLGDDGKTPVDWRLCLVPKSDYEIIDTWYAMGMAATGSKDVAVSELFVP